MRDPSFLAGRRAGNGLATPILDSDGRGRCGTRHPLGDCPGRIDRPSPADGFADIQFGDFHALVIGNNEYRHLRNLKTVVNDATDVAALLKRDYGYSVTLLRNASRGDIPGQLSR